MRLFNLLLLLLITGSLSAQKARISKRWLQEQDSARQAEFVQEGRTSGSALDRGFGLHLMPLSFFNRLGRMRLGGQLKRNRWCYMLDVEVGHNLTQEWISAREDRDFRFFGVRPEIRYDLDKYDPTFYVAMELPLTVMNRFFTGRFTAENGDLRRVDEARQARFRISGIAKIGVQFLAGEHVFFDFYAGLGVAYRDIHYTERVGETEAFNDFFEWGISSNLSREGGVLVPEIAAGLRFGWWF